MSWVLPSDDVQDIGDCHQTLRKILLLSKFPEIGAPQNHPFLNMFIPHGYGNPQPTAKIGPLLGGPAPSGKDLKGPGNA